MKQTEREKAVAQVREFLALLDDLGPQEVRPGAPLVRSLRTILAIATAARRGET